MTPRILKNLFSSSYFCDMQQEERGCRCFLFNVIRHGQTEANREQVIQGQNDVPLSAIGEAQALALGDYLKTTKIARVYTSDLQRASQTAKLILSNNCGSNSIPFIQDERIRERCYGEAQGKKVEELQQMASLSGDTVPHFTPPGGETLQELRNRAQVVFMDLCTYMWETNSGCKHTTYTEPICCQNDLLHSSSCQCCRKCHLSPKEVILVAHSRWIKELVLYFMEELGVDVPGGASIAGQILPNTGLSKFLVVMDAEQPRVKSLKILKLHEKAHLTNLGEMSNKSCDGS